MKNYYPILIVLLIQFSKIYSNPIMVDPFFVEFQRISNSNWSLEISNAKQNVPCDTLPCIIDSLIVSQDSNCLEYNKKSLISKVTLYKDLKSNSDIAVLKSAQTNNYLIYQDCNLNISYKNKKYNQTYKLKIPTYNLLPGQSVLNIFPTNKTKDNTPTIGYPNDNTNQKGIIVVMFVDTLDNPIPDINVGIDDGLHMTFTTLCTSNDSGQCVFSDISYYTSTQLSYRANGGGSGFGLSGVEPDSTKTIKIVLKAPFYTSIFNNPPNMQIQFLEIITKQPNAIQIVFSLNNNKNNRVFFSIKNSKGKNVWQSYSKANNSGTYTYDINHSTYGLPYLQPGVYYFLLENNGLIKTKRFVIN